MFKILRSERTSFKWKHFLQAVFRLYDRDGTGYLSAFELRQALNSAGYRLNNHILNILVHRYGTKDDMITFDDFIMCAVRLKTMIGKSSHVFYQFNLIKNWVLTFV